MLHRFSSLNLPAVEPPIYPFTINRIANLLRYTWHWMNSHCRSTKIYTALSVQGRSNYSPNKEMIRKSETDRQNSRNVVKVNLILA